MGERGDAPHSETRGPPSRVGSGRGGEEGPRRPVSAAGRGRGVGSVSPGVTSARREFPSAGGERVAFRARATYTESIEEIELLTIHPSDRTVRPPPRTRVLARDRAV